MAARASKSKRTVRRHRRERLARSRCSNSSLEHEIGEDYLVPGYSSNETLKAYEKEVLGGLNTLSPTEETETNTGIMSTSEPNIISSHRPSGKDKMSLERNPRPPPPDLTPDQLLMAVDNYLKKQVRHHSNREDQSESGRSSGSSLTLTETEMEDGFSGGVPSTMNSRHSLGRQHMMRPNIIADRSASSLISSGRSAPGTLSNVRSSHSTISSTEAAHAEENMFQMKQMSNTMPQNNFIQNQALPSIPVDGKQNFHPRQDVMNLNYPQPGPNPMFNSNNSLSNSRQTSISRHMYEFPPNTPTAAVPLPHFTPVRNDNRPKNTKFAHPKYRRIKSKYSCWDHCSWKCMALVLLIMVCALITALICLTAVKLFQQETHPVISVGTKTENPGYFTPEEGPTKLPDSTSLPLVVEQIPLGAHLKRTVQSGDFLQIIMQINDAKYVQLNLTVGHHAFLAVYGRRGGPPTHTVYDFVEVHSGRSYPQDRSRRHAFRNSAIFGRTASHHHQVDNNKRHGGKSLAVRQERSMSTKTIFSFVQFMEEGSWYIGIFNDGKRTEDVKFIAGIKGDGGIPCLNDCSGNGQCVDGQCKCYPTFTGEDCSKGVCPTLCSTHGQYHDGVCICNVGWMGAECEIQENQCLDPDCSGNGRCINSVCICNDGFVGPTCREADCMEHTCSGNGICQNTICSCHPGWAGYKCHLSVTPQKQGRNSIVSHTGKMTNVLVNPSYLRVDTRRVTEHGSGPRAHASSDYSTVENGDDHYLIKVVKYCEIDSECGDNGECLEGHCRCLPGWGGMNCSSELCMANCGDHGTCVGSTCKCDQGWNGKFCSLDGCPSMCNGNGLCNDVDGEWSCSCVRGFGGESCDITKELDCEDSVDNDGDLLRDCEDPDCCMRAVCSTDSICKTVPDPTEKVVQSEAMSRSFYDRMKFLMQHNSVQIDARIEEHQRKHTSVVRGMVMTEDGSPLVGVMVTAVNNAALGRTYTRYDGVFDMLVVGGGSIKLQFTREPFAMTTIAVLVPYGDFIYVDNIAMILAGMNIADDMPSGVQNCYGAHRDRPSFVVLPSIDISDSSCSKNGVMLDRKVVHERIVIPRTRISLDYLSSNAPSHQTTISIELSNELPDDLTIVHVHVSVQGKLFKRRLEPEANLQYTFSWDRTDAYGQKVYGEVSAIVSVGYEFQGCKEILWDKKAVGIQGYDLNYSGLAGWNLPMLYTYNPVQGVVTSGDGSHIFLQNEPMVITTIMGNGKLRSLTCSQCNGLAKDAKMRAPVALAADSRGNIYVGDYNFIRKIDLGGDTSKLVKLSENPTYKYYLATSPLDGDVYISSNQNKRIYRILKKSTPDDVGNNIEAVAGTGTLCLPVDSYKCGDDGPADEAKLISPKGISVANDGTVYFIDGNIIRMISPDGVMGTFLGSHNLLTAPRAFACDRSMSFDEVSLNQPTEMSINRLDNSLYVVDDDVVLRITMDRQVTIVAGVPVGCHTSQSHIESSTDSNEVGIATREVLISPTAISLTNDGKLFVAESSTEGINRVRLVTPNGMIQRFVGRDSTCDCMQDTCDCFDGNKSVAVETLLHAPTALTTLSDGTLVIADQGNLRIRTVGTNLPSVKRHQFYEIPSDSKTEVLVFDSFGQHVRTRDTLTEQVLFNFTYTTKRLLKTVSDVYGNVISIDYNSRNKPTQILVPTGDAIQLTVSSTGFLSRVHGEGLDISIKYTSEESGLLQQMSGRSGHFQSYNYDEFGHLMSTVTPTGYSSSVASRLNRTQSIVSIGSAVDARSISFSERLPNSVNHHLVKGDISTAVNIRNDGTSIIKYPNDGSIILEPGRHPLFQGDHVILTTKRKISFPGSNVHRLEWRFYGRRGGRQGRRKIIIVGRRLRVNGDNVLTFEYNRFTKAESVKLGNDEQEILTIHHNNGHPNEWRPSNGLLPVNVSYDNRGRFTKWQQGLLVESFKYDTTGHLVERAYDQDMKKTWQFAYDKDGNLNMVILPSGKFYELGYDDRGFLATIIMPSGLEHNVKTSTGIGFYRKIYSSYNSTAWLVVDKTTSDQPLRLLYPRTKRLVQYTYDTQDRPLSVIDEQQVTKFSYNKNSGQLRTVDLVTPDFYHQLRYKYYGSLTSQQIVRTPSEVDSVSVRFIYEFDENFKVSQIRSEFNMTDVADYTRQYDPKKGLLVRFGGFSVMYDHTSTIMQAISDNIFSMQKQFGSYILLQSVQYQINNRRLFVMTLLYDTHGRVANRSIEFAEHRDVMSYQYNDDGQLIAVEKNSNPQWHYSYDRNGNMETVSTGGSVTTLEYDGEDRITKYGAVHYKIDKDGFLTQRGNEVFEYNSQGQLMHAHQEDQYQVWYQYDGLGRRIWRKDHHGARTQYFYADVERPSKITHIFEHGTQEMWILDYDLQGHLFSINKGGRQLYVATDHVGTPYGIFNTAGETQRQISYTPFGGIISDVFPEFVLHIGFMGGLYDPETHLVHINKRDYDPRIGRWTTPDVGFYSAVGKPERLKAFNMYTFFGNNPTNIDKKRNYLLDTASWLPLLGFNIQTLMPQVTSKGEVWRGSPSEWKESANLCKEVTSPMCKFANQLDAFNIHFKANPTTQLIPSHLDESSKSCSGHQSKSGLQLTLQRDTLFVNPPESGTSTDRNIAALLSGAIPLQNLRHYEYTKEHVYLVKESEDSFLNDLRSLGLTQTLAQRTIGKYNISVVQRSLDHRGLDVSTDDTVWHIYFGVSINDAREEVMEFAKLVATEEAWKKEQENLIDMKKGRRTWSAEETRRIIEHGRLTEYDSYYIFDVGVYPQIAFDGNSITFLTPEEATDHTQLQ